MRIAYVLDIASLHRPRLGIGERQLVSRYLVVKYECSAGYCHIASIAEA